MSTGMNGGSQRDANLTIAVVLIFAGVVALVAQLVRILLGRYMWPFSAIVPGVLLVVLGLGLRSQASELCIFVVGFVFFERVIGLSGFGLGSSNWPIVIIVLGVVLLVRNGVGQRRPNRAGTPAPTRAMA